ncbi:hypothetical protein [Variovorax paradoxus]|uniref:Uncharacterized protein n=1 Tax=Variovorax paradoxus (strain EPS) TaxID=595537 RepID=E6V9U8_VARPE|nr:hypothetical protein [Variovorax paradoxus]ADU36236.1 hypothetical protein Varpa_2028 [Variovorax paradoxus EPS]
MSCESLEVGGCETLVLKEETPTLLEVAVQGPPGPPGADGDPGPPGTTDYNDLINTPTLGSAAAQNVEFFAAATSLITTNSNVGSLSTSTSTGWSTATSRIASLSTVLSAASSNVSSLSTSTSSGLSTSTSSINSLSTSTSSGLSTSVSGIASLSTSTSSALSAVAVSLAGKVDTAQVGIGVAPLVAGLVPSIYLPSYVDDVLEFASLGSFPGAGEAGKIYIALDTSRQYRWSGSAYTELLASPGTTDNVVEGVSNLYFTVARVRNAVLTGLVAGANAVIAATDSVIGAFQKLQAQISALVALDAQNVKITGDQDVAGMKSVTNRVDFNTGSSMRFYNTADKVTNTEYSYFTWVGNEFRWATANSGTGVNRAISLQQVARFTGGSLPYVTLGAANAVTTAGTQSRAIANHTAASGTQTTFEVFPTIAQTGTAGYTAFNVNPQITTTGSGNFLLQTWQVTNVTWGSFRSNGSFATRGSVTAGSSDGLATGSSFLNSLGSLAVLVTPITASTTLGITHGVITANATAGNIVITLPAASSCPGRVYPIKRIDSSVNTVTIVPNGADLVDFLTFYSLERILSAVTLRSDGSRWIIESRTESQAFERSVGVVNLMSDSGKMTARANPLALNVGAFDAGKMTLWFVAYNGSSAWSEVGKFIFDNTTNGGAAGALTATTSDLIAAMGRTGTSARYGSEFYIAERTAGAGTANPHPLFAANYLSSTMNSVVQAVMNADRAVTFAGWIRAIDNDQVVVGVQAAGVQQVYLNGVRQAGVSAGAVITPAMGWCHVRVVIRSAIGYQNASPNIYAQAGQKFQVALPAWMYGEANPGVHTTAIQTINELIP